MIDDTLLEAFRSQLIMPTFPTNSKVIFVFDNYTTLGTQQQAGKIDLNNRWDSN